MREEKKIKKYHHQWGNRVIGSFLGHEHIHPVDELVYLDCGITLGEFIRIREEKQKWLEEIEKLEEDIKLEIPSELPNRSKLRGILNNEDWSVEEIESYRQGASDYLTILKEKLKEK